MRPLLLALLTACATDDLGEVTEDIKTGGVAGGSDRTCFLSGVDGELSGWDEVVKNPTATNVEVSLTAGSWGLHTTGPISGEGVCVAVAYTTAHEIHYGIDPKTGGFVSESFNGTANTHCFLRQIQGSGLVPGVIELTQSGTTWSFSGSSLTSVPLPTSATAVCFDYAATGGWGFEFFAGVGSSVVDLRDSYPSGPLVPTSAIACGLTGVHGDWSREHNQHGQVWLDRSGTTYQLDLRDTVGGDIACVR